MERSYEKTVPEKIKEFISTLPLGPPLGNPGYEKEIWTFALPFKAGLRIEKWIKCTTWGYQEGVTPWEERTFGFPIFSVNFEKGKKMGEFTIEVINPEWIPSTTGSLEPIEEMMKKHLGPLAEIGLEEFLEFKWKEN